MNKEKYLKFFNDIIFYLNGFYETTASINASGEYPATINFCNKKTRLYIEMHKGYIYFMWGADSPLSPSRISLPDITMFRKAGVISEENKIFIIKHIFQFVE